jgi:uncharacterized membrane protein YkvA (DUF1232 family)
LPAPDAEEFSLSILQDLRQWARSIKRDAVTLWFACRHPGTPKLAKVLAALVVAYALSPIDLIPDFIPVLGYVDDVLLLPGLIWLAVRMIPPEVRLECQRQGDEWMRRTGAKPKTAWGVVFVATVWIAVAFAMWRWWMGR